MQIIKLLKKCIVILGIFLLLIWGNIWAHNAFGSIIEEYVYITLLIIPIILTVIEVILIVSGIVNTVISKMSKKLFEKVITNATQKVKRYINNCDLENKYEIACLIISEYISGKEITVEEFNALFNAFKCLASKKAAISYFFLKNCSNELFANYLKNNNTFQIDCTNLSEMVVKRTLKNVYEFDPKAISFDYLQELSLGLLHLSLPQNQMIEDDTIHVMRSIITWMCNEVNSDNVTVHKEIISVLIAIFELNKRIKCSGIRNEYLEKDLNRLKKSEWIEALVNSAYKYLVDNKGKNYLDIDDCVITTNIISFYYQYIGSVQKYKIYSCINEINTRFENKYSDLTDDTFAAMLILASSLEVISKDKQESDYISLLAMAYEYSLNFIDKIGGVK